MTHSEQVNELAAALAKAQAEMTGAKRDSENPFFKSKYADLASTREACLPAMNKHGLSVLQLPRLTSAGDGAWLVEIETVVLHSSGQFIRDTLAVPVTKADAQGVGSAISYARRYALAAVSSVAPEDDDANAAVGSGAPKAKQVQPEAPKGFDNWWTDMQAIAANGVVALQAAWNASRADHRRYLTQVNPKAWEALKDRAMKIVPHEVTA